MVDFFRSLTQHLLSSISSYLFVVDYIDIQLATVRQTCFLPAGGHGRICIFEYVDIHQHDPIAHCFMVSWALI